MIKRFTSISIDFTGQHLAAIHIQTWVAFIHWLNKEMFLIHLYATAYLFKRFFLIVFHHLDIKDKLIQSHLGTNMHPTLRICANYSLPLCMCCLLCIQH